MKPVKKIEATGAASKENSRKVKSGGYDTFTLEISATEKCNLACP